MKTLLVVASSLAFICLAARPARAQCCGTLSFPYHIDCGCGNQVLYQCYGGSGSQFMVYVTVNCGLCPNRISTYAPAGECYDGVVVGTVPPVAQGAGGTGGGEPMYVNAYVRDCTGRYVAVRMAMALG